MNEKDDIYQRRDPKYKLGKTNAKVIRRLQFIPYLLLIIICGTSLFFFLNFYQARIISNKLKLENNKLKLEKKETSQQIKSLKFSIKNMESVLNDKDTNATLVKGKLILPTNMHTISDYKVCAQRQDNPFLLFCKDILGNKRDFRIYLPPDNYYIYAKLSNHLSLQHSSEFETFYYSESSTSNGIQESSSNEAKPLSISKDKKEIDNVFLADFNTCKSKSKFPYCILNLID